jgi:hypothetical protein
MDNKARMLFVIENEDGSRAMWPMETPTDLRLFLVTAMKFHPNWKTIKLVFNKEHDDGR